MEELVNKLEEKYGFVMSRVEAMEAMKISNSTIKRMEADGRIEAISSLNTKIVKFHTKEIARVMLGE